MICFRISEGISNRNSLSSFYRTCISQSHPLPTLRYLKRLFILGDWSFFEVFLFEFAFFYESLLFLTNAIQQHAGWLVVGVLGYKATFYGFLKYGVA